jgi:hypothetical protein
MRKHNRPSILGRRPRVERAAVYATAQERDGSTVTFRVGQPVHWIAAQERWARLAEDRLRPGAIRFRGRKLRVKFYEVRSVDRYGRRLDSNRADQVIPVPYTAHRVHGR